MATESIDRVTDALHGRGNDSPSVGSAPHPKFEYPGIPTTCDGAEAVVWVETRISAGLPARSRSPARPRWAAASTRPS